MLRVLLVDDDPVALGALRQTLTHHLPLASTDICADPCEALARLAQVDYTVVLTDYTMPRLNGIELMRAARQQGCDAAFILLTGEVTQHILADGLRLGVFALMSKPFEPSTLLPLLQQAVECHRLRREVAGLRRMLADSGIDVAGIVTPDAESHQEEIQPLLPF